MEIHAHSSPAPGGAHTPGKKWTHYLWEFLMLFLAVFCGFIAENIREHYVEKERGKQYIRSFYEDLVTDSSQLNRLISRYQLKVSVLQNMSPCYDSLLSKSPPKNCLTTIIQNTLTFPDLIYTDRTLQQLKNAGGLRLLNRADADSILLYDNLLREYKANETSGLQESQSDIRNTFYSLVNYESWKDSLTTSRIFALYGNNKELLNRYFNQLKIHLLWCKARLTDLQQLKKRNAGLIDFFKNKYHLE